MDRKSESETLAAMLRARREEIMTAWEERVRDEVDAARDAGRTALRDHLPNFLARLADALDPTSLLHEVGAKSSVGETHGKERADLLAYTIPQVLHEYSILRHIVFDKLEVARPLTKTDRDTVLRAFDSATRQAADAFMDERTERERERLRRAEQERDLTQNQVSRLEADRDLQQTFVATLTHDLRNPIGAVKMALELLTDEITVTQEVSSLLEIMGRNLERSETMLHDLLDSNRVKSGRKLPLAVEPCNLTHLVKMILAEMLAVHGQGCILKAQDDVRGYWSTDRLRRVIGNLVDNAIKYGVQDGPITLSLAQDAKGTTISVHNNGAPIPPDVQATIFEPHYRIDGSGSEHPPGWGLGLTLVHAVAEAHGGNVRVESTASAGTTFIVTLPNDCRPFQT